MHTRLSQKEKRFLDRARVCRVASADGRGTPHVAPLCHAFDAPRRTAYIATEGRTARNLMKRPTASLACDDYFENWSRLRGVDARGRDEPHRGEREREWDDRRNHHHRRDLDVAVHGCLRPRQEPGRMYDAPPDKREPKTPHEKCRRAVRLAKTFAEREVKREDERVHRSKREAERVELAQSRVVRTGRKEAPENGEHRGNPEAPADRSPAEPRVDQEQDRPGVLDDEGNPDRDALDRLVIDERNPGEPDDAEHNEERQVGAANPQVKAHRRKDRNEYKESEEDTPLREDGRLHTRVEGRLRDNAADTKERGRC